ncbi:MAG: thioredoxin family protein [Candidatus Krumholzibacteriota bacterium]|nr:thioredoxin family protein [Candidatus Krumholzibacteriota bacterium]
MIESIFRKSRLLPGIILIPALMILACPAARAQTLFSPGDHLVDTEAYLSLSLFHPGSTGYLALRAEIKESWHINSHTPLDKYLIPTELVVNTPPGIEVLEILYPPPDMQKLSLSDKQLSLYHGTVYFGALIKVSGTLKPGSYAVRTTLRYQGCDDLTCLEPVSATGETSLTVGTIDQTTELLHPEIFRSPPFVDAAGEPHRAVSGDKGSSLGGMIAERGLFISFLFIFVMGLALNLTPCIYPLIPITISYFGGQAGGKTSRVFLLSLLYVLGMSITYSTLGVIAATTGSIFGSALQNPWVILFIALVIIGLATSMFGLWEIRLPLFLTRKTGTAKQGYLGALFMGLTVGIVAAPCIGPFVLALLTYVGETGNPVLGFLMFFTLAWGMGIPFIVLGMASGSISRLPSSGHWMIWVRKIFGFILLLLAVFFARHFLGARLAGTANALIALAAGLYLGWWERTPGQGKTFNLIKKLAGLAWIAAALFLLVRPGGPIISAPSRPSISWTPFTEEELSTASASGKPVMIDFTADWCIPCHELESRTFSDPAVIEVSRRIVNLRVDLSTTDEKENEIKRKFDIKGAPTIIFIDGKGREVPGARIAGFVGPEKMLESMNLLFERR